jgi:hypothetical protein
MERKENEMLHAAGEPRSAFISDELRRNMWKENNTSREFAMGEPSQAYLTRTLNRMELESRILQWRKDSQPPQLNPTACRSQLKINFGDSLQHVSSARHEDIESPTAACVLYHPDFTDWSQVVKTGTRITLRQ